MGKLTVNQLTRRYLITRKECFAVDQVERQTGRIKRDCFGFADFVGVTHNLTYWVQATSLVNISSRMDKVLLNSTSIALAGRGDIILVLGWKGPEKGVYQVREELLSFNTFLEPEYISQRINIKEEELLTGK